MIEKTPPTKINLWQLYAIINRDIAKNYSLNGLFYELYSQYEREELEEMGINTSGLDHVFTRECVFEDFVEKILNNIIDNYNDVKDLKSHEDWANWINANKARAAEGSQ